jgi:hypothetical protein
LFDVRRSSRLRLRNYASRTRPSAPDGPHAPKTFRAKGDKKMRRETREDFSRKEKYMRFAASRCLEMTMQSPKNKGKCFVSRPRATKRKTAPNLHAHFSAFPRNSDSECSAYPSGLLTYIIHRCTPSPFASRCQLAHPDPSLLAHAGAALPIAACECQRRCP